MPDRQCTTVPAAHPIWAARVRPERIRQLYRTDALGFHDERLIDDVGFALAARCRSILRVTSAMRGHIICPACEAGFDRPGPDPRVMMTCPSCGWGMTWEAFHRTFRGKKLYAGAIEDTIRAFLADFETTHDPRRKMIAIDRLIHTFHHEATAHPTAPAAKNLIQGNVQDVVALLNDLTYGDSAPHEMRETKRTYQATLARSWAGGVRPEKW